MTLQEIERIPADEKGIIVVLIDGVERKFIKTKLVDFLLKFDEPELLNTTVIKVPIKRRRMKKIKTPVAIPGKGVCRRKAVIAILPDGSEIPFISIKQAGTQLNINHTNIPKVLKGNHRLRNGIKFRYA